MLININIIITILITMFNTTIIKELYTCFLKKDELTNKRKEQMENYQNMIQPILNKKCYKDVIEFYKLFENYNYQYNLQILENPLKCDKLEELINHKNYIIGEIYKLDICQDIDKIKELLKTN